MSSGERKLMKPHNQVHPIFKERQIRTELRKDLISRRFALDFLLFDEGSEWKRKSSVPHSRLSNLLVLVHERRKEIKMKRGRIQPDFISQQKKNPENRDEQAPLKEERQRCLRFFFPFLWNFIDLSPYSAKMND